MTHGSEPSEPDVAAESDASDEIGHDAGETAGDDSDHLDDIEDGAGCAEIWERLSERREAARNEAEGDG